VQSFSFGKSAVRCPAVLGTRYAGEEFVLLLPNTNLNGAVYIGEQIRLALQGGSMYHDASQVGGHVTLSLGVTSTILGWYMNHGGFSES
jgi:diguanylate cyclase (GGDEF)-like protein